MIGDTKIKVRVTDAVTINPLIKQFRFVSCDGSDLPAFSSGAHIFVEMEDNGTRRLNQYSLMSTPEDLSCYTISVRRDDVGRGGSVFMHNSVKPGMEMVISHPINFFPLDVRARKHLFVAGGIGITPFIAHMAQLLGQDHKFELHYSARSHGLGAYVDHLKDIYGSKVHCYFDDQNQKINLENLLQGQAIGTHVYVCGPKPMISWVRQTAEQCGWPDQAVHYEEFLAPPTGKPFVVELARSKKIFTVSTNQSLLEAIEAAGVDAPYLCRGGACGQCITNVVSCDGEIEHNDHWFEPDEHNEFGTIMPCVSRFCGKSLVLDR